MTPSRLLTAGEVATWLRVTKAWVYTQTRANHIPYVPTRALRPLPPIGGEGVGRRDRTVHSRKKVVIGGRTA